MSAARHLLLLVTAGNLGAPAASSVGDAACPCLEFADLGSHRVGNDVVYQPVSGGPKYMYSTTYGTPDCKAHDLGLSPFCNGASSPAWCAAKWCYVDPAECSLHLGRSVFFTEQKPVYFSYQTCGSQASYFHLNTENNASLQMIAEANTIMASTRQQVQASVTALAESGSTCREIPQLCTNTEGTHWKWNLRVDFASAGAWLDPAAGWESKAQTQCVFDAAEDTFLKTAVQSADKDGGRIGYIYMADQETGSYLQWPNAEFCPKADYDPRLRPFYSAGATSPKDVLMLVDVSGSMSKNARSELAKKAVKAILKTLSWKDFVGVILFNSDVAAVYKKELVPASEQAKADIERWADRQTWAHYGTNFRDAFREAFETMRRSIDNSKTSTCQKVILFLTDGEDLNFQDQDYINIRQKAEQYGTIVFTYALGSGADATVSKKLACQNKGVFQQVPDNADLGTIMSKYYEYFVAGQHTCNAQAVKFLDPISKTDLYTSCMPIYNDTNSHNELLGVTCMDYSVMADIAQMRQRSDWDDFICRISDASKTCRVLELTECHRQKIRAQIGAGSVCSAADAGLPVIHDGQGECSCIDPSCEDNPSFIDEKGYLCDQWVGDRCEEASHKWMYSNAGQDVLMTQCRKSCGKCGYSLAHCKTPKTCPTSFPAPPCRACSAKITGSDIDGKPICCKQRGVSCDTDFDANIASAATPMKLVVPFFAFALWVVFAPFSRSQGST